MSFYLPSIPRATLPQEALGLYRRDGAKQKANLTVGTYWDEKEKLYAFESVAIARKQTAQRELDHNYQDLRGPEEFRRVVTELVLGKTHQAIPQTRTFQTFGSTGALTLTAHLLKVYFESDSVYISSPSWPIYERIFNVAGVTNVQHYRYVTRGKFDLDAMLEDLLSMGCRSSVILQVCSHNPTGCDPSLEDWHKIATVIKQKNHRAILDAAYHGFVSGDPHQDLEAVRIFAEAQIDFLLCQSFSKNLSLYCDRIGALTLHVRDEENLASLETAILNLIYYTYISPTRNPPLIVEEILGDTQLRSVWYANLSTAVGRLDETRRRLYNLLQDAVQSERWDPIVNQKGLYCYLDMDLSEVKKLRDNHSVYMLPNGRINLSGINDGNIVHVAKSLAAVVNEQ